MNFFYDSKVKYAVISFAVAFAAVMLLFIHKPHIVRSRNKYIRTFFIFAIAFVPGVLAASICAKTVTTVFGRDFSTDPASITMEERAEEEEEREEEHERNALAG